MPESVEGFFASIGAIMCLVVVTGGAYRAWQLRTVGWWQVLGSRAARLYWRVSRKTVIVLPVRADNLWWETGEQDGNPCMQVAGLVPETGWTT